MKRAVNVKAKVLLLQSLLICLLSACAGAAPARSTTGPAPTIAATTATSAVEQVWSTTGDPNPFDAPDGVALDQQGNLYVMDSGNSRIQKLDSAGRLLTLWGSYGSDDGQFRCSGPCMVAVDGQGNVYVTDGLNARVQKFDSNGKFLAKWGSLGAADGQFDGLFGVAVDGQGNVYVGDVNNARVQEFDSNGKFLAKWGSSGNGDGQFSGDLADIAVDSQGNVYVTDRSNGLQKFDSNKQFVAKWDHCGDAEDITAATGVSADTQGNVYFYDLSHNRLCRYDNNGRFQTLRDNPGNLMGGIAVDQQGNIYVAYPFDNRVSKLRQR